MRSERHQKNKKVILVFLHKHRVNDLEGWLESIASAVELNVLLLVSNETVKLTSALLNTRHSFDVINIDNNQPSFLDSQEPNSSITLLFKEFRNAYCAYKSRYQTALNIFKQNQEGVLVTYDDRMTSLLPILKAGFKTGIPIFLPAILTMNPNTSEETSNTLRPIRKIEALVVKCVKLFFPTHVNSSGRLFYDAVTYLTLLWFCSLPKHPWAKGSLKYTNRVGVESQLAYDQLCAAGVDASKLVLTGLPIYDLMDFSKSNDSEQYEVLVCALPQYGEHGAMEVEEALLVIEGILNAFTAFKGKVVISLHPRMDRSVYQPLIDQFGYYCAEEGVEYWIKRANIFFSAASSTTVYWSLMMGVPTVLFNHIPPSSDLFSVFKSIRYINHSVEDEVAKICQQPHAGLNHLLAADQEALSISLVTDGNVGARNARVIDELFIEKFH
ncbi:MAG: hypothetical protein ACRBEE_07435 [Arenicella sp.]